MNEYIIAIVYIIFGLIGASGHYLKKRYVDFTTDVSFITYLKYDRVSTINTIISVIFAEITLSLSHGANFNFSLSEIVAILTSGYTLDSGINRAPPKES